MPNRMMKPTPISEVHERMMAEAMAAGADKWTAYVTTMRDARIQTPIITHGSGKVVVDDVWAKYELPRKRGRT